jgi:hypothetical protein
MFVHTLLFLCPACKEPSAASFVRYERNPEGVDAQVIFLDCEQCMTCSEVLAVTAKRRWVMEWDENWLPSNSLAGKSRANPKTSPAILKLKPH